MATVTTATTTADVTGTVATAAAPVTTITAFSACARILSSRRQLPQPRQVQLAVVARLATAAASKMHGREMDSVTMPTTFAAATGMGVIAVEQKPASHIAMTANA